MHLEANEGNHDEIAGDMRREQPEADHVDEAADE
jgi:hypothetical protein